MILIKSAVSIMSEYVGVSGAARRLHERPRTISDLFYQRLLDDDVCPIVGGRRLIPITYLPKIAAVLKDKRRRSAASDEAPKYVGT